MHKLSLIKRCCPNFWRGGAGQQKGWGQRGRAQKREERDLSIQVLGEMERGGEGRRYQVPKCAHFGGTKKGRKFDNLRSQAHSLLLSSESLLLSLSRARFLSLSVCLSVFCLSVYLSVSLDVDTRIPVHEKERESVCACMGMRV